MNPDSPEARAARRRRTMVTNITELHQDDRRFDREFWQQASDEAIFEAAWELVCQTRTFRGDGDMESDSGPEPRLQRSVCRVVR